MSQNFLLVGLGNPGTRFVGTRHNIGRECVQRWAQEYGGRYPAVATLCPDTMMNNSGAAVAQFLQKNPVPADRIVLVHDELELPLGEIRQVSSGSAKGHNGVRSIHTALGTNDIPRIRLGIGRPPQGVSVHDFVLGPFLPEERDSVQRMFNEAARLLLVLAENNEDVGFTAGLFAG